MQQERLQKNVLREIIDRINAVNNTLKGLLVQINDQPLKQKLSAYDNVLKELDDIEQLISKRFKGYLLDHLMVQIAGNREKIEQIKGTIQSRINRSNWEQKELLKASKYDLDLNLILSSSGIYKGKEPL